VVCEKCEVRFYYRKVLLNSQAIKVSLLKKGWLDRLAEDYAIMPMYREDVLNIRVKPIKNDNLETDFKNNRILVEAC